MAIHNSTLASLKRCPQKFKYAYIEKLERKHEAKPLKRGTWLHFMLAVDALRRGLEHESLLDIPDTLESPSGLEVGIGLDDGPGGETVLDVLAGDDLYFYSLTWEGALALLTEHEWDWLPDDVQALYYEDGISLPDACRTIMRGYLWRWKGVLDKERPLLVEVKWERTDMSGPVPVDYGGRADEVLLDSKGKVVVRDWKTTKATPSGNYRLRERQRLLYAWGLEPVLSEHGLKVDALELDYLLTKTPPKPRQNQPKKPKKATKANPEPEQPTPNELKGELSKAKINTTPIVFLEALREYGLDLTEEHKQTVRDMERGAKFYMRFPMPLNQKQIVRMLAENAAVAALAKQYQQLPQLAYRVEARDCDYMCEFNDICLAESLGQDASTIKAREFQIRQALVEEDTDDEDEE